MLLVKAIDINNVDNNTSREVKKLYLSVSFMRVYFSLDFFSGQPRVKEIWHETVSVPPTDGIFAYSALRSDDFWHNRRLVSTLLGSLNTLS